MSAGELEGDILVGSCDRCRTSVRFVYPGGSPFPLLCERCEEETGMPSVERECDGRLLPVNVVPFRPRAGTEEAGA